jgi:hypothetical protein
MAEHLAELMVARSADSMVAWTVGNSAVAMADSKVE